ncbi:hypothetical protein D3OALGA1CA_367 [Olavius algarvensis associated proteobacterium Delta 3]|nr:hypothetical protein D3OALGA1CA_367 [Olavius algarvensis associated proteobacterium Delta 3]CAB5100953.1 hypothetical protein D3OALGB2SA_1833 [Olavius algarvensis associated proteobacterium Delta 3]
MYNHWLRVPAPPRGKGQAEDWAPQVDIAEADKEIAIIASYILSLPKQIIAIVQNMFRFKRESGRYGDRPYVTAFVGRGTVPAHKSRKVILF